MRVYWTTLNFLSIFCLVYIYIVSESFPIKDYYWQYASKKIQIVWIHTVAACSSDLLLNFKTSFYISFPLNWMSVFSWRNGKKSCSLTSCVACSRLACSSDLLLNFKTSFYISFPLNWMSVFSWRNGKKSCSLTSCVACSRLRDSRESSNTKIKREETGERRRSPFLFLFPSQSTFRVP